MPQVKGKVGKSKVVKVKNETMPTPQGRRVIPRITSTMKVQAVKKERGKTAKVCHTKCLLLEYISGYIGLFYSVSGFS